MAWTSPMTFVDGTALTAAQLNTHLRDNMLETAPAKVTTQGSLLIGAGANQIVERLPVQSFISNSETTTSTSFTDLATVGPTVTATTGTTCLLFIACQLRVSSTTGLATAGTEISGATTEETFEQNCVKYENQGTADRSIQATEVVWHTTLTPGENTFTMKYKVSANTGTFSNRRLVVIPL